MTVRTSSSSSYSYPCRVIVFLPVLTVKGAHSGHDHVGGVGKNSRDGVEQGLLPALGVIRIKGGKG